jgi:ApbE superfamily uncharacterized protein (UPF0280 family)
MEAPSLRKTARTQLEWIWSLPDKVLLEPLLQAVVQAVVVMAEQAGPEVHSMVQRAELVAVLEEMAGTPMAAVAAAVDTAAMEEAWLHLPMSAKAAADMGLLDCLQMEGTDINPQ